MILAGWKSKIFSVWKYHSDNACIQRQKTYKTRIIKKEWVPTKFKRRIKRRFSHVELRWPLSSVEFEVAVGRHFGSYKEEWYMPHLHERTSAERTQALVETIESSTDWFDSWSRRWLIFHRDTVWATSSVACSPLVEYFVLSPGTIYPTKLCWIASKMFRAHRRCTCPNGCWKRAMRGSMLKITLARFSKGCS